MKNCIQCNFLINSDQKFCGECGAKQREIISIYNDKNNSDTLILSTTPFWKCNAKENITIPPILSEEAILFGSWDEFFYSLNKDNGELNWKYNANSPILGPCLNFDKYVYFGTNSGVFYSLEISTGRLNWNYKFPKDCQIRSAPLLNNNKIIVVNNHGLINWFDYESGKVVNSVQLDDGINRDPVVYNNMIGFIGWRSFYLLEINSGTILWKFKKENTEIYSAVYFDQLFYYISNKTLYAIDPKTQNVIWEFVTKKNNELGGLTIEDEKIYLSSSDGNLYVFNRFDGFLLWKYNCKSELISSPRIINNYLFTGCRDGNLICLNKFNGDLLWKFSTNSYMMPQVVSDKRSVYVTSPDSYVRRFDFLDF